MDFLACKELSNLPLLTLKSKKMISIAQHTELFSILGYSVQTWGTIVAIGIIIALVLMLRKAQQKKVFEKAQALVLCVMISAIIGARFAYIIINLSEFHSTWSLFEIWNGGLISWGFILGGIIGTILFKIAGDAKNSETKDLLDMMAPYFILAIAIGRIGCFLRGCCFGIPSSLPWAVSYDGEISIHPTQIYHSIADFIIFFILLKINKKKDYLESKKIKSKFEFFNKKMGTFLLFILLYSAERFFIDFLRYHPASEYVGAITITQIIFVLLFAAAFWLLSGKIKKERKTGSAYISSYSSVSS